MSKTSTTVAVVAVLTAATLVVGLTLAATVSPSAFAGSGHGNTVTKIISSNRGSASGHGQVINQCTFNGQHVPC
jgi:hypothetical protein